MERHRLRIVLAIAAGITVGIAVFVIAPATPTAVATNPVPAVCTGHTFSAAPAHQLSPEAPVLLPMCGQVSIVAGGLQFEIASSVDFHGAWSSSLPMAVAIINVSSPNGPNWGWPNPGSFVENGTFNITLFPGNYAVVLGGGGWTGGNAVMTVTEPFEASFDRDVHVVTSTGNVTIPGSGIFGWPIPLPSGASSVYIESYLATTSCDYEVDLAPNTLYQSVMSNNSPVNSLENWLITGGAGLPCTGQVTDTPVGLGTFGPMNLTNETAIVFQNFATFPVVLSVWAPVEVSYLNSSD